MHNINSLTLLHGGSKWEASGLREEDWKFTDKSTGLAEIEVKKSPVKTS